MNSKKINIFTSLFYLMPIGLGILLISPHIEAFNENVIYGIWKGKNEANNHTFIFNEDGTCKLIIKDNKTDSIEVIYGNFEIDFSKKPIPISIRNIPNLNYPLHTILKFVGKDSMRLANFSPRWRVRPIVFELDKSIDLKRIKKM